MNLKPIALYVAITSCFSSVISYAHSGDKGNGGDGVILNDGRVLLYDFFERSVDTNKRFSRVNYTISSALRAIPEDHLQGIFWEKRSEVYPVLVQVLEELSKEFPYFTILILKELQDLYWIQAEKDLPPNTDTASVLDPNEVTIIGCALNVDGEIQYAPTCGQKMAAVDKAGLIMHEAVYSLYKRLWQPRARTSFNVRTIVAQAFEQIPFKESLNKLFIKAGLARLNKIETKIQKLFFGGNNYHYSANTMCDFASHSPISKIRLNYSGALRIDGTIHHQDQTLNRDGQDHVIGSPWRASVNSDPYLSQDPYKINAWLPSLPQYDLENKLLTMEFSRTDGRVLKVNVFYDGSNEITAHYFDGKQWQKDILGQCSRVK